MSLLIGLHIQKRLSKNPAVTKAVGDRIFPVVATQGSPSYPFIIFDSSVGNGEDSKDGEVEAASVNVCVFGKSYGEAIHLAHEVKKDLQNSETEYKEFRVDESNFLKSEEDYDDDLSAYIVNLNFEFITEEL